jgi:rare lipoprotein A
MQLWGEHLRGLSLRPVLAALVLLASGLAACTGPGPGPAQPPTAMLPPAAPVQPIPDSPGPAAKFVQTGLASWYGSGFHRKHTASGERYDMNDLTAAHRSLPLDTVARVTNLTNSRSVLVRINDRGPFAQGRVIDLSRSAAQLLGMTKAGVVPVRIEVFEGDQFRTVAQYLEPR